MGDTNSNKLPTAQDVISPALRKQEAAGQHETGQDPLLLNKVDVKRLLACSAHQIEIISRQHRARRAELGEPYLASSPSNGLCRLEFSARRHAWDPRDVREYIDNAHREGAGLPPANWRRDRCAKAI